MEKPFNRIGARLSISEIMGNVVTLSDYSSFAVRLLDTMDTETIEHLWALQKVNKALIVGLTAAIHTMEHWEDLSGENRKDMIGSLKGLVEESRGVYGEGMTEH